MQWLVNLFLFVVAPLVYRRALAVLADLSPESDLGARLRADETGNVSKSCSWKESLARYISHATEYLRTRQACTAASAS